MPDPEQVMSSEEKSFGQKLCLSSCEYVLRNVSPASEAFSASSKNIESNTNGSSLKPSSFGNLKEKSVSYGKVVNRSVISYGRDSTKPFISKYNHVASSSNFVGQRFNSHYKAPRLSSGKLPVWATRTDQMSAKIPTHYSEVPDQNSGNSESSTELVRGPRANRMYFPPSSRKNELGGFITRDQFNKPDFQISYEQAKFFMIKSYSEDDIHKSIKYSVWSSTSIGNKKLQSAFRDAEMVMNNEGAKCPIFLFFSVNTSGQFVGVAEMIGPVDFKKDMDFWQKDKWNGFFPVKWHIIKDIPNAYFQNITLENNDNRAVTFSRDTQEIGLPQGLKMLQFFRSYPLSRSLLDDFDFYDEREKLLISSRNQQQLSQAEAYNMDYYSSLARTEAGFDQMRISEDQMRISERQVI
ncbi:Cleavage and polyadenylation specificity factor CPSF30 [Apostasia shenzhenica]|uniref:YTH domain-containing family protein n=1 Tax=Apostasia shenzhenica TaxID=1088818 RepID=A0A2I0B5I1_9ASPA|nr:Cleavage and polyadenylation specificity factor CPSF30 [Apostasia shenzhenica]